MRLGRIFSVFFVALVFASFISLIPVNKASAFSVSASFVSRYSIKINSLTVSDSDRDNIRSQFNDISTDQINQLISNQILGKELVDNDMLDGTKQYEYKSSDCGGDMVARIKFQDDAWELVDIKLKANFADGIACETLFKDNFDPAFDFNTLDQTNATLTFLWQNATTE